MTTSAHATTSLLAALDVKAGTIISKCMPRHRAQEFRRFLDTVENDVPAGLDHPTSSWTTPRATRRKLIRDSFVKRPRSHYPLHANLLVLDRPGQRFFALLTEQQIKRGVTAPSRSWRRRSPPIPTPATPTPSPSAGPEPPRISSVHRTVLPPYRRRPSPVWIELCPRTLAAAGYRVFPVRVVWNATSRSTTRFATEHGFKAATTDEATVRRLVDNTSRTLGVAVATGNGLR